MFVSQKTHYALRALFELAVAPEGCNRSIREIARAQEIPPRFLEAIMADLRRAGFVASRRGSRGGYVLAIDPRRIRVGDVVESLQGPVGPVACAEEGAQGSCGTQRDCPFTPMWQRVNRAVRAVYDDTNLADLAREQRASAGYEPDYVI